MISSQFSISPTWTTAEFGPEEERQTSAELVIALNGWIATRFEDDWSRSVRTASRLSAYPLATWLAGAWWRLLWEPAPESDTGRSISWRMSHELPAAGHGFLWPNLAIESDGETVDVISRATRPSSSEPIRYLASFRTSVPRNVFERTISDFVNVVIERLNAVGLRTTALHALWEELVEERRVPESVVYRSLEARLGFDPDEAPETTIEQLQKLSGEAGPSAPAEIAPVCSGDAPEARLTKVIELARGRGILGKISKVKISDSKVRRGAPWSRGKLLADYARRIWALNGNPISDTTLSEILGVPSRKLFDGINVDNALPVALAVRTGRIGELNFLFRKRGATGRRFEAARLLADHLLAGEEECWLPATDFRTARQKVQRAFAAEFLCPVDSLEEFLAGDFSDNAIEEAGYKFAVSPLLVRSHLVNNGLLSRDAAGL